MPPSSLPQLQHHPPSPSSNTQPESRPRNVSNASSAGREPPCYPPESPAPPPTYNSRPTENENTLIAGAVPPPEGVITESAKHFVVALTRQHLGAHGTDRRPTYGRAGLVAGMLEIKSDAGLKLSDILSVTMQITGKIKLDISEGGTSSFSFLDYSAQLYPQTAPSAPTSTCPSIHTFAYALPTSYQEKQEDGTEPIDRALPPTYSVAYDGVPGLRAEVKYRIKFKVERRRLWRLTQTHTLSIPFDYVPRSRPPMPGPEPTASFAAALKQTPEDWAVFVNDVPRREAPTNRPVHYAMDTSIGSGETVTSSFVLPSSQTFPLGQAIPFHLQLSLSTQSRDTPSKLSPLSSNDPTPSHSPVRRPKTAPTTSCSRARTDSPARSPIRPSTAPSKRSPSTLLSLFADPTFGPSPRGRRMTVNAVIGLGEGHAGDGAMAFGDPRDRNLGRHPGGIAATPGAIFSTRLAEDVEEEEVVVMRHVGRGRGAGRTPNSNHDRSSSSPSNPRRPMTAAERRISLQSPSRRPVTVAGTTGRFDSPGPGSFSRVQREDGISYVRVFLQRQIVVTVKGQKVVKTIACGDGKLHRITLDQPPTFGNLHDEQQALNSKDASIERTSDHLVVPTSRRSRSLSPAVRPREGLEYIAWEGHVLPSKDLISVGGFRTTGLWVKDFITLTMVPPNPEQSPLRALHHAVPIRLVSDPWEEEWWGDRRF